MPLRNLHVNKRLSLNSVYRKFFIYVHKNLLGPFGEIGAYFLVQLSSRSHFANIENKKVIAENQCEKHENQGLTVTEILPIGHSLIRKMRKHTGASKGQNNGF